MKFSLITSGALTASALQIHEYGNRPIAPHIRVMSEFQENQDVADVMEALVPIEDVLMNLDTDESEVATQANENGTFSLEGGTDFVLSQEQFNTLKDAVSNLRSSIVLSEI